MFTVAVLVGSLRRDSINAKLAKALGALASSRLEFRRIPLADLPLYNEDLWEAPPAAVLAFKQRVEACDAVLFLTPEYNRGIPAVLKNAFDWGTRPYGQNSWAGKPGAVAGTSPGAVATAVAQFQLRAMLVVLDVIVMGQPELYFRFSPGVFDDAGHVADDATRAVLEAWILKFEAWISRMSAH
jgi:chromate reductase